MLVEEIGGVKFAIQRDFANFVTKTILGQNWLKAGYPVSRNKKHFQKKKNFLDLIQKSGLNTKGKKH